METTHNTQSATVNTRRLERPTDGRVLGGVAAGIANHTGASVGFIRLGLLVAALFGGFGVVLYLAAWALVPAQTEDNSAAERWLRNLTTPGKRAGAFFIGLAGIIVLAGAAPATVFAAVALLAAAALLANNSNHASSPATETTTATETDQQCVSPN